MPGVTRHAVQRREAHQPRELTNCCFGPRRRRKACPLDRPAHAAAELMLRFQGLLLQGIAQSQFLVPAVCWAAWTTSSPGAAVKESGAKAPFRWERA
jgi:hypothetical protein